VASVAAAQNAGVIPQGVLAIIGAHRTYVDQTKTWDSFGARVPLDSQAQLKMTGENLLRGDGGSKLKELAEELERYDPNKNNPNSLVRRLNLGTLKVGGSGKINIQYFGIALGLPSHQTLYLAAPVIDLRTQTQFTLSGENNANALKEELGALAYNELKDGLTKAAKLNVRDVKASVEAAEYTGVDTWIYRNFGDIVLGYAAELVSTDAAKQPDGDFSMQGELFCTAPTGHLDHPDILADLSVGAGTWGFGLGLAPRYRISNLSIGLDANTTGYLPFKQVMRIPVSDESIIAANRRTSVSVTPGLKSEAALVLDGYFDWLQPQYKIIVKRQQPDSLAGSLQGNYAKLTRSTEKTQFEHAFALYLSSIDAFARKEFPIPLRLKFAVNHIFKGINSFDETFFEFQLLGFLPTPWMAD
jgi:hypothetical protein